MPDLKILRDILRSAIAAHVESQANLDSHNFALARLRILVNTTKHDYDAAIKEYEHHARISVAAVTAWAASGGDGAPPLEAEDAKNRARRQRDDAAELLSTMEQGLRDLEHSGASMQAFARDTESKVEEAALPVARAVAAQIAQRMRELAAEWNKLRPQISGYFEVLPNLTIADAQIKTLAAPDDPSLAATGAAAEAWVVFYNKLLTDPDAEYMPPA